MGSLEHRAPLAAIPSIPAPDLERLRRTQNILQMRFSALQGRAAELIGQKNSLVKSISLAKARIELAPLAVETFNFLQEKAHSRAVGEFETLLTAFVEDVIPESGEVRLELGTERGAPALEILMDNNGNVEGILDGNGGGLTNVVVTALTFAAQARAGTRALVVLDEPDCWLKASRVPAFTRVIAEVANPSIAADGTVTGGCQTLLISHNDITLMDEGAHLMELRTGKDGAPLVASIAGAKPWANEAQVGVRWIEVENLRAHAKTRLELCPGLNVLTGDVNLGKSTLFVTAIRALAYGETDDSMIRHESSELPVHQMTVRLGLENQVVLEVTRYKKASPKVVFRRYDHGVLVNEARQETKSTVPEFISNVLRVHRVDDLDIQLRSQKQPIFLLDETPARRARLLSVGRESGLLQALIEKHRLALRRDRESVKREEVSLNTANRTLSVLAPLHGMTTLVRSLDELLEEAKTAQARLEKLKASVAQLESFQATECLRKQAAQSLSHEVFVPQLLATSELARLLKSITSNGLKSRMPQAIEAPLVPSLTDTAALRHFLSSHTKFSGTAKLLAGLPDVPLASDLQDITAMATMAAALEQQLKTGRELAATDVELSALEKHTTAALANLMQTLAVCPLCAHSLVAPLKESIHVC